MLIKKGNYPYNFFSVNKSDHTTKFKEKLGSLLSHNGSKFL